MRIICYGIAAERRILYLTLPQIGEKVENALNKECDLLNPSFWEKYNFVNIKEYLQV